MKPSGLSRQGYRKEKKTGVWWRFGLGGLVVIAVLMGSLRNGVPRPDPTVVLILPFDNRGEDTGDVWLGEFFAEGLSRLLKTSGDLLVTDELTRREVYQWAGLIYPQPVSLSTALLLAREVGADWLIYGTYRVGIPGQVGVRFRLIHLDHRIPPRTFRMFVWRADQPFKTLEAMGRVLVAALQRNGVAVEIESDPWMQTPFAQVQELMKLAMIPNSEDRWRRLERLIARSPDVKFWRLAQLRLALEQWDTGGVVGEALDRWLSESGLTFVRPEDRFLLAAWHYLNHRWNAALEILLDLSTEIPMPGLVNDIGVVLAQMNRYDDAKYYFVHARRVREGVVTVWNPTILAYRHHLAEDVHAGLRALWRLSPSGPAVDMLARVFRERGRNDLLNALQPIIAMTANDTSNDGFRATKVLNYIFVYPLVPVWSYFETQWQEHDSLKMTAFVDYEEYKTWELQRFYQLMERDPTQVPQWLHLLEWLDASMFPVRLHERWLYHDFGCNPDRLFQNGGFITPTVCCPVLSEGFFERE